MLLVSSAASALMATAHGGDDVDDDGVMDGLQQARGLPVLFACDGRRQVGNQHGFVEEVAASSLPVQMMLIAAVATVRMVRVPSLTSTTRNAVVKLVQCHILLLSDGAFARKRA